MIKMADLISDDMTDGDILTSYSNPNYTFGITSGRVVTGDQCFTTDNHDSNGNISVGNNTTFGQKSMDDSSDSAISSPATDSALASPNTDDIAVIDAPGSRTYDGLCIKMQRAVQLHQRDELEYNESSETRKLEHAAHAEQGNEAQPTTAEVATKPVEFPNGVLPPGWQRHEDKEGPYYWHIKSGTIQREVPIASPSTAESLSPKDTSTTAQQSQQSATGTTVDGSNGVPSCQHGGSKQPDASEPPSATEDQEDGASRDYEVLSPDVTSKYPIRFAVRSLGWVPIAEDQLTQESSSRAVNQCIVKLSGGLRDVNDVVGRWGDGKYLYMDLDQENLSLIDPHDLTVLNVQPIRAIRVWGVGRDSGRDFAYVARDRTTRQHMCHVFRCELPARHIANTLCEICKKIIAQRAAAAAQSGGAASQRTRPTDLPNLHQPAAIAEPMDRSIKYENLLKNSSFPTPMDEPRKTLNCYYLGTLSVAAATGVDILNGAIDSIHGSVPAENWTYVSVTVAPSTITISEHNAPDNVLAECRVRFLSFLGISLKNVRLCAFIMHTAQDQFVAYVFYCEPSAGALCKTIEAACKLRYQKCLDKSLATGDGLVSPNSLANGSVSSGNTPKDFDSLEFPDQTTDGPRASFWEKADGWKTAMSSSLATVKAGTMSTATMLKESMQGTASVVKNSAISTGISLRDGLAVKANSARTGLSITLDSFKKKTETYFKRDS